MPYQCGVQTVIETRIFTRRVDALLSARDRDDLVTLLASQPLAGVLVPRLGGVRRLRFAPHGRGKSGAFRVIYFFGGTDMPVYALLIYGKNERADLSPAQRRAVAALAEDLKEAHRGRAGKTRAP